MDNKKIRATYSLGVKILALVLLCVFVTIAGAFAASYLMQITTGGELSPLREQINDDLSGAETVLFALDFVEKTGESGVYFAVLFLIFALVCIVYLLIAAGRHPGEDKARLNFVDRLPLDVYFAFVCAADIGLLVAASDMSYFAISRYDYSSIIQTYFLCFLLIVIAALLSFAWLLSFASRIKCGGWWRNTLTFYVLKLAWRIVRKAWEIIRRVCSGGWRALVGFFRMIPIVWRTAVILGAVCVAILMAVFVPANPGFFPILFLLAIIFVGGIFGAWQMRKLKAAGQRLAAGDYDEKVDTKHMYWEFKSHGENLNSIADGMQLALTQKMRSERLKTELITNVSHDIKTPLTSIVNYVDLLKKATTDEERTEYLEVLDRQAQRLKKLTEDLVEASKASTGNLGVDIRATSVSEIVNQAYAEYSEKLEAGRLAAVIDIPEELPSVMADGRLLWRVMDNLFGNVVKYAMPDTRVYIDAKCVGKDIVIEMKNISRAALNISAEELMERFVRGDGSRTTDGSGLGLSIAKSLIELQHGSFKISTDADLFKAEITLPAAEMF